MKLTINISKENIQNIQRMLKVNGYEPLDQSALQEILEIKAEEIMEFHFDHEGLIEFFTELVDAGELDKIGEEK